MTPLLAVLICFAGAMLAPLTFRLLGPRTAWVMAAIPAGLLIWFGTQLPPLLQTDALRSVTPWVPGLNVNLSFRLDGLSMLFSLLITGIGAVIVIYAGSYLSDDPRLGRFYVSLMAFMAAMLGLVLSDNVIALFVFWELTSITSYLLIGFDHTDESSRKSALQALMVTALGGLALLAGLVLFSIEAGSFELSRWLSQPETLISSAVYIPALTLVLLGAFTKSAQWPFHFWLPNAMAAPTPVSAYLHSATMVKAGVYLLARLQPAAGGTEIWVLTLTAFGTMTLLTGAILTLRQTDLKKLLAYSTVAALGALTLMVGLPGKYGSLAYAVFLLAHSLYKAPLFLAAGMIDYGIGSRDVRELSGLSRFMPITATVIVLAGLSLAGLPPALGFIGKELLYAGSLELMPIWVTVLIATGLALGATLALILVRTLVGTPSSLVRQGHEAPAQLWLGPLALATLGLVFGVAPGLISPLINGLASASEGKPLEYTLKLWPGFNAALLASGLTVLVGVLIYPFWPHLRSRLEAPIPGPANAYELALNGLIRLAAWQTRLFQSGLLRNDLRWVFVSANVLVLLALWRSGGLVWPTSSSNAAIDQGQAVVLAAMVAGAILVLFMRGHLAMLLSVGLVGVGVALLFMLQNAPDLALTQFLVEVLTTLLIAFVMMHLRGGMGPVPHGRGFDKLIALGFGVLVAAVSLMVLSIPLDRQLPGFFEAKSVSEGFGRNVVNVILVDFRGLDTLGEITVVGIAGLGVVALLGLRLGGRRKS